MIRVVGVGDNTVDRYAHMGMMFPGGNAVNVPVLAHRAGCPASYIGWLGDDRGGRLILDALREEGIDVSRCRVVAGPTSYSTVTLVDGDRVFGGSDHGVSARIALDEADLEFVGRHDLTHTSIYSHTEEQLPRLREASRRLSFDFSSDWSRDYLTGILPWTDIAILSLPGAAPGAVEDLLRWAHAQGPTLVVVSSGSAGSWGFDGGQVHHQGIAPAEVVDTLGAGDALAARLLVDYLGGASLPEAMAAGAAAAAEACGWYGAFGHGAPYSPTTVAARGGGQDAPER